MRVLQFGILSVIAVVIALSCANKDPGPTVIDIDIDLWVRDKSGRNLLDPANSNSFNKANLRVFYIQNGVRKEFYNPNLDAPHNVSINQNTGNGEYWMRLIPYEGTTNNEITTTFLHWNDVLEDTLRCQMVRISQSVYPTKIWYNNVLKYDESVNHDITWDGVIHHRLLEIIK